MSEGITRDIGTRAADLTQLQRTSRRTRGVGDPGVMLKHSPAGCGGRASEGIDIVGIGDEGSDAFAEQSVSA